MLQTQIFERYFATPQTVDYASLCAALSVHYQKLNSLQDLDKALKSIVGEGIRVFEIITDRKKDAETLRTIHDAYRQHA